MNRCVWFSLLLATVLAQPVQAGKPSLSLRWGLKVDVQIGDHVWFEGQLFEATHAHRSRGERPDLRDWRPVPPEDLRRMRFEGPWRGGRHYDRGVRIVVEGDVFEAVVSHDVPPGGRWDRRHWRRIDPDAWYQARQDRRGGYGEPPREDRWEREVPRDRRPEGRPGAGEWREGPSYERGEVVSFHGRRFRCLQSHRAHRGSGWTPMAAPSLWEELR